MSSKSIFVLPLAVVLGGCIGSEPESEQWRRARQSTDQQEWQATNGMAWPSSVGSQEGVMTFGMEIIASTANGEIRIRAGQDYERFYTWNGATRSAKLWPRKQRWWGSRGMYYPGPGEHWKSNGGITRGVLNEGVLWFKTVDDAMKWIERAKATGDDLVFTDDGLVIAFGKVLARKQVNVDVWQIMIAGGKPRSLPGSKNDLVSVSKSR